MTELNTSNVWLPVEGDPDYTPGSPLWMENTVANESIKARMRYVETPIWDSMFTDTTFWTKHFENKSLSYMNRLVRILGIKERPGNPDKLRTVLANYFIERSQQEYGRT